MRLKTFQNNEMYSYNDLKIINFAWKLLVLQRNCFGYTNYLKNQKTNKKQKKK